MGEEEGGKLVAKVGSLAIEQHAMIIIIIIICIIIIKEAFSRILSNKATLHMTRSASPALSQINCRDLAVSVSTRLRDALFKKTTTQQHQPKITPTQ